MKSNQKQLWIGIGISAICIVAIFWVIEPREIWEALKVVRLSYLILIGIAMVIFLMIRAWRWQFMLGPDVSWWQVFHIQNIGYMLNMVLPFRIGDMGRAVLIGNVPPATIAGGISTMVVEQLISMLTIIVFLPFTLASVDTLPLWMQNGAQAFGFATIFGVLLLVVAANQRPLATRISTAILNRVPFLETKYWLKRIEELLDGLNSLTRLKDGFILIVLSILVWVPILFAYYIGALAVGINITPMQAGFVMCAAALSVALPSSPGQIGVFHAAVIGALQVLGQPEGASASFAIVYHAMNLTTMIIMGLIGLSSIGSTFANVVDTAQRFMQRSEPAEIE